MTRFRTGLVLAFSALMLAIMTGLTIRAQDRRNAAPGEAVASKSFGSVQEALLRPYDFTFARPTPLEEVARHLARTLGAPVVIDRAALDRQGLKPDDEVQLSLAGVRLKTGLKLLLDQLDLTFKVVPEDNLLILTDPEGSHEPIDEILTQIKALHRELHDVQDAIDALRADLTAEEEGARMRKPTIIEDVPPPTEGKDQPKAKEPPPTATPGRSRRGV